MVLKRMGKCNSCGVKICYNEMIDHDGKKYCSPFCVYIQMKKYELECEDICIPQYKDESSLEDMLCSIPQTANNAEK